MNLIIGKWAIWESNNKILLSDENIKLLRYFKNIDDCINWLFLNGDKESAKILNKKVNSK